MTWDYIVIGAGSAGCALAQELANSGTNESVLVLEAGGSDRSPFIRLPAGVARAMNSHDWGYRSLPDPSRDGTSDRWWRGRVLGGSSSINSTIFARGAAHDFNRWAEHCRSTGGWSADEVIPIFRELERSDQPGPLRGRAGPLHVTTVKRPHAIAEAFIQSARAAGYPFNSDYNGQTQDGVAYAQLSQRAGFRCSAADAFLRPLLGRSNIKLLLNALVERIEVERGRAVAVSFLHKKEKRRETARDIIVCAGAINSPKLLMLSGIGDAQELERHHIDVVNDLPAVGRNLREHPLAKVLYRTRIQTYNLTGGLRQRLGVVAQFLANRAGPISSVFESVAFLKTSPSEPFSDVQLHFVSLGNLATSDSLPVLAPFPSVTVLVNKSHSVSRGRVRLASSDPRDPPLIECRLFEDQADIDTLARGIVMVRGIMQMEPMASLLEEESEPGASVVNMDALRDHVRRHGVIANHAVGTCAMGIGMDAVVAPDLRVRGMDNLWVADASIMPDHISGNTSATCMMIGKKLGKQLVARSAGDHATHGGKGVSAASQCSIAGRDPASVPQTRTTSAILRG